MIQIDMSTQVETAVRALGIYIDFNIELESANESKQKTSRNAFQVLMNNRSASCLPKKSTEIKLN